MFRVIVLDSCSHNFITFLTNLFKYKYKCSSRAMCCLVGKKKTTKNQNISITCIAIFDAFFYFCKVVGECISTNRETMSRYRGRPYIPNGIERKKRKKRAFLHINYIRRWKNGGIPRKCMCIFATLQEMLKKKQI